jgi:hypothetical protein
MIIFELQFHKDTQLTNKMSTYYLDVDSVKPPLENGEIGKDGIEEDSPLDAAKFFFQDLIAVGGEESYDFVISDDNGKLFSYRGERALSKKDGHKFIINVFLNEEESVSEIEGSKKTKAKKTKKENEDSDEEDSEEEKPKPKTKPKAKKTVPKKTKKEESDEEDSEEEKPKPKTKSKAKKTVPKKTKKEESDEEDSEEEKPKPKSKSKAKKTVPKKAAPVEDDEEPKSTKVSKKAKK